MASANDVEKLAQTETTTTALESSASNSGSTSVTDSDEDKQMNMPLRQAVRQYSKFVWYCMGMSTVILLWGYDQVVVGTITAIPKFQKDYGGVWDPVEEEYLIPALWLSLWSAFPSIGLGFGALTAGPLQDRIGRRLCLLIGSIITTGSILIMFFSNRAPAIDGKRGTLLAGKMLQGYGLGIVKIETLTYISENIPTCLRGASMALFPAFTLLGQLTGALVIFGVESVETDMGYLVAIGSQWILSICPMIMYFILPESPAYLVRRKEIEKARHSLHRLLAPKNDADATLEKLRISIEAEEKIAKKVSYGDCFKGHNRRRTLIAIFANLLPPLFGLPLLSSVSYFMQQVGMNSRDSILFLIVGIVLGLIANVGSTWTLSHLPRRRLSITTLVVAALFWAIMGVAGIWQNDNITPWITAAMCMAVVIVCGVGVWPASYAIMSEASALRLRAKTQAIGGIAAYISAIFTYFVLPYLYNPDAGNLKAKTGFVFAGTCLIAAVMTWFWVPEMKGRSVLEIDHLFEEGVKARHSSKWVDRTEEVRRAAM